MTDLIATQLTGSGRAAVATIAVRGIRSVELVMSRFNSIRRARTLKQNRIYFGNWSWQDYSEELVVCRVENEVVEIHCHGGQLAARSILTSLKQGGASVVSLDQWLNALEPDRFVREAIELLPRLKTSKAVSIALNQSRHAMRNVLVSIRQQLSNGRATSAIQALQQMKEYGSLGVRLESPFRVVVLGPPNCGKSSLMNALVGYDRAIVYDQPGTTRDIVSAEIAIDGWLLTLSDTAGIRPTNDPVEKAGIGMAAQVSQEADLVLVACDLSQEPTVTRRWLDSTSASSNQIPLSNSIRVGTKSDIGQLSEDVAVGTSSKTGAGIEELRSLIVTRLIPNVPPTGAAVPVSCWQLETVLSLLSLLENHELTAALDLIGRVLGTNTL